MKDFLEILANIASILTAVFAAGVSAIIWWDRTQKRRRLVEYLRDEATNHPATADHTIYNIMSKKGLTQDEIIHAAFNSPHVQCKVHVDPKGVADGLRFGYKP